MSGEPKDNDGVAFDVTASAATGPARDRRQRLTRGDSVDKYLVLATLGEGGMGVVYAAYDPDLDRRVALKLLRGAGPGSSKRLLREAQAMARLHHPNVVTIYEVGTAAAGDFVAMQLVEGATLADWLHEQRPERTAILEVFLQAGRGLEAAHAAGLIHRDFKASNVLVDARGVARVTDFGLARSAADRSETAGDATRALGAPPGLTQTGAVLGTPAYMAPEQFRGAPTDARTDQFAFCASLYEALYGARAFPGASYDEIRHAVIHGELAAEPAGASVPGRLRRILVRGLSVDPAARYPSMAALLAELEVDASAVRRRWLAGGAVALAGVAVAYAVAVGTAANAERCPVPEDAFAGVWDPAARARVEQAFATTGAPTAGAAFAGFAAAIDAHVAAWQAMHVDACRAARVDRRQTEPVMLLRMTCLQDRRAELDALIKVYGAADVGGVEQSVEAAERLSPLDACADIDALEAGIAPPGDPETRERVAGLRRELADAKALMDAGQLGRALGVASSAVRGARAVDYAPVLAEALLRAGAIEVRLTRAKDGRELLDEAILVGEESGHDRVRAEALVELSGLLAAFSSDRAETRRWHRRAHAAVQRLGDAPRLEAALAEHSAALSIAEQRYGEAVESLAEAEDIYRRAGDRLALAEAMLKRAQANLERGQLELAAQEAPEAVALMVEALGAQHPETARAQELLAAIERDMGHYGRARAIYAATAGFWSSDRGRDILEQNERMTDGERPPEPTRVVSGVVYEPSGEPAPGVEVIIGEFVLGDGAYAVTGTSAAFERKRGLRRAITDIHGQFRFADASVGPLEIIADRVDRPLRSRAQRIEAGGPVELGLRLGPVGSVEGRLSGGAPDRPRGVKLEYGLDDASRGGLFVVVRDDGRFRIDGVAPGDYELVAFSGNDGVGPGTLSLQAKPVTVTAGATTRVDLSLEADGVAVAVDVHGERGLPIASEQLVLIRDRLTGSMRVRDLRLRVAAAMLRGGTKLLFQAANEENMLERVEPGAYSLCVVPLAGDYRDPDFMKRLHEVGTAELDVHCQPVVIARSPELQRLSMTVPPMKALPAPVVSD